jgi:hypothetical protein
LGTGEHGAQSATRAVVSGTGDGQGAKDRPILKSLKPKDPAWRFAPAARSAYLAALGTRFRKPEQGGEQHGADLQRVIGLRYNRKGIAPGAQAKRSGIAKAGEGIA